MHVWHSICVFRSIPPPNTKPFNFFYLFFSCVRALWLAMQAPHLPPHWHVLRLHTHASHRTAS